MHARVHVCAEVELIAHMACSCPPVILRQKTGDAPPVFEAYLHQVCVGRPPLLMGCGAERPERSPCGGCKTWRAAIQG